MLPPKKSLSIHPGIKKIKFSRALKTALSSSWQPIRNIVPAMTVAAILVFQLIDLGFFDLISKYMRNLPVLGFIPSEGLPIIAAWFASNAGAYTIAGKLLSEGILSSKEIIITLLTGRVLSSLVRLRFTIPYYTGIFSPGLGFKIMLLATLMQEGLTLIVIIMLALFW